MSYFEVEEPRPIIPAGQHTLILREVCRKAVKSRFADTQDGRVEKILWRFESVDTDEAGDPYEYVHFTGTRFGN
jgi:hypothetical protein